MLVNATINFPNQSRLFLVEDIFDKDLCQQILSIFKKDTGWTAISEFDHYAGRLVYSDVNETTEKINSFAGSKEFVELLETILGKELEYSGSSLWLDLPGYKIVPHYDLPGFDYAVQVYMPDPDNTVEMLGTCFYKGNNAIFEIHYRHNVGYFIDKTHTIYHGLNHDIPDNYKRQSVYLRYRGR